MRTLECLNVAWWDDYEEKQANEIKRKGFRRWLKEVNEHHKKIWKEFHKGDKNPILEVRSPEQAIIWELEITGQMSDGEWENSPQSNRKYSVNGAYVEGWVPYADAVIKVTGKKPRFIANCWGRAPSYNLTKLLRYKELAGRMLLKVRKTVNPNYTYQDLRRDLIELRSAISKWSSKR